MPPENPKFDLPDVETVEAEVVPDSQLQLSKSQNQYLAVLSKQDITQLNTAEGLRSMTLGQKLAYASLLIESGMVPKHFNTPQKALLAFEKGEALGLRPIEALDRLYVIDGKVSMYAELVRSRARLAGMAFQMTEEKADVYATDVNGNELLDEAGNRQVIDWRWTVEMYETLPSGREITYKISKTYTWAKNEAQVMGNPVWKKFMTNMFFNRITAFLVRMYCPEVLLGLYEFSELADTSKNTAYELDDAGNPVPLTITI